MIDGNQCYSFDRSCFDLKPSGCTDNRPAAQVCAPTVTWFWLLAAGVGVAVLMKNGKR